MDNAGLLILVFSGLRNWTGTGHLCSWHERGPLDKFIGTSNKSQAFNYCISLQILQCFWITWGNLKKCRLPGSTFSNSDSAESDLRNLHFKNISLRVSLWHCGWSIEVATVVALVTAMACFWCLAQECPHVTGMAKTKQKAPPHHHHNGPISPPTHRLESLATALGIPQNLTAKYNHNHPHQQNPSLPFFLLTACLRHQ